MGVVSHLKSFALFVILLLTVPIYAWKMESGTVHLNDTTSNPNWVSVTFQQAYAVKPLVFTIPTEKGGDPASFRIRNVTTTGFEILQVEPSGSNGPHIAMKAHYVAIDPGEHYLPDGTHIVAASFETKTQQAFSNVGVTTGWDAVTFSTVFSATPVVLGTIQSAANEVGNVASNPSVPWLTPAIKDVTTGGFDMALERSEVAVGDVNKSERVAYLAIDGNVQGTVVDAQSGNTVQYETIVTDKSIKGWGNGCFSYNFVNTYAAVPNIVGTKQTRDGDNGGWLRECNAATQTSVALAIDEDKYHDSERVHIPEIGGLLVFEKDFVFDSMVYMPVVEYRMDECYWLGSTYQSVKDSSINGLNGNAYNNVQTDQTEKVVNFSGNFDGIDDYIERDNDPKLDFTSAFTVSLWVRPIADPTNNIAVYIEKYFNDNNTRKEGWGVYRNKDANTDSINFIVWTTDGNYHIASINTPPNWLNSWHYVGGVFNGNNATLYVDTETPASVSAAGTLQNSTELLKIGQYKNDYYFKGNIDEVKIWRYALTQAEIDRIKSNESVAKNYDGSPREEVKCDATITANSWELVGIPIDLRDTPLSVRQTFLGMGGTYGTDWRVYRRDYSEQNNSSWYTYLDDPDINMTEFGKAYWLGNKQSAQTWNVNGTQAIDYNSSNPACTAGRCVEIDMKSVTHDFAVDGDDGTGSYRYNMTGFMGKSPVDWADCRFIIDGTAYTPSEAETAGYTSKQIWQYNPGNSGANSNGYTTCDDTTPGSCLLEPYKGFWIELHGPTKGKSVKLLVPKE